MERLKCQLNAPLIRFLIYLPAGRLIILILLAIQHGGHPLPVARIRRSVPLIATRLFLIVFQTPPNYRVYQYGVITRIL